MDDRQTPAGWYPDPLGLPQLRWWDGQGWGEHTSEARRPLLGQQARSVAFADPDHHLVVALAFNGLPGEPKHQQRTRDVLTSLYEELDLAPKKPADPAQTGPAGRIS